jgi:RNA polymerase sigma-70 factor (ECF subfamily)
MTERKSQNTAKKDKEEKEFFDALLAESGPQRAPRVAEELHRRYHRLIYYSLTIFDIPDDQRQDLFNQIFLKIIKGLARIKHCDNIKSWIITITKNEIFTYLHRREKEVRLYNGSENIVFVLDISDGAHSSLLSPEQELLGKQLREAFRSSVERLEEEVREPFLMRYRELMKWGEIASILGLKADTARKRAEKARRQVLRDLQRHFGKGRQQ